VISFVEQTREVLPESRQEEREVEERKDEKDGQRRRIISIMDCVSFGLGVK
jgi:hypothetical protein